MNSTAEKNLYMLMIFFVIHLLVSIGMIMENIKNDKRIESLEKQIQVIEMRVEDLE